MRLEQVDFAADDDRVAALHRIHDEIDEAGPPLRLAHFTAYMRHGWAGDRGETWAAMSGGEVVGGLSLEFPDDDNTHLTLIRMLAVGKRHRRQGLGGALLDHAIERSRAEGRRLVVGEAPEGPGEAFAKARGFQHGIASARRVLDLRAADWDELERMRADAAGHAQGYGLERWVGSAPEDRLDDMVVLMTAMNDAPDDDLDVEGQRWSGPRWRRHEASMEYAGLRSYTMIARHTATGAAAGFTRVHVDPTAGDGWARQADTAVVGDHRGHRLGILLKLATLAWFHESEPHVEQIMTWNAASNTHMVGINERMGYRLFDVWHEWQLSV